MLTTIERWLEPNARVKALIDPLFRLLTRVWTQLIQHLMAKMWSMARKFWAYFSKRVDSLRMSFILQKKRSTMLRMA